MSLGVRRITAIATREFAALFRVPVGWLTIAVFLFLIGLVFVLTTLQPGSPATMRGVFGLATVIMIVVAPAISMRLISDELRSGTAEPLLSAPVAGWQIAAGKFAAGLAFLAAMLGLTALHAAVLALVSSPAADPGPVIAGLLSLLLLGSVCIGLGLLASSLTESQTLAFLGTVLLLVGWVLLTNAAPAYLPERFGSLLSSASPLRRIDDFARGVIDLDHVLLFGLISGWTVAAAGAAIERRRWA